MYFIVSTISLFKRTWILLFLNKIVSSLPQYPGVFAMIKLSVFLETSRLSCVMILFWEFAYCEFLPDALVK